MDEQILPMSKSNIIINIKDSLESNKIICLCICLLEIFGTLISVSFDCFP